MSAIRLTCHRCGTRYTTGMVGSIPWPAHTCTDWAANYDARQKAFEERLERHMAEEAELLERLRKGGVRDASS